MIPETENPQEAKGVYPGKPARHAQVDSGRYFMLVFSRDGSHMHKPTFENILAKVKLFMMSNFTCCHNIFNLKTIQFLLQRISIVLLRYFQGRLLQNCCMWENFNRHNLQIQSKMHHACLLMSCDNTEHFSQKKVFFWNMGNACGIVINGQIFIFSYACQNIFP